VQQIENAVGESQPPAGGAMCIAPNNGGIDVEDRRSEALRHRLPL
jgi:hypothetical protein